MPLRTPRLGGDADATGKAEPRSEDGETLVPAVPPAPVSGPLLFLILVACTGGFLFGYDTGVVSGSMLEMKAAGSGLMEDGAALSPEQQEVIVSTTVATAAIGSVVSGIIQRMNVVGRRGAALLAALGFVVAAALMAAAQSFAALVVGRLLVGLAVGVASHTVPIYIAEVAPAAWRGALTAANSVMIVSGQVAASMVCCGYAYRDRHDGTLEGWRWMLGWGMAPALLMAAGLVLLPESPAWLLHGARSEERARQALIWLRSGSEARADVELQEMKKAGMDQGMLPGDSHASHALQRLCSKRVRSALVLGVGLQVLQQAMGINTIMYYSSSVLQMTQSEGGQCRSDSRDAQAASGASSAGSGAPHEAISSQDVQNICMSAPVAGSQLVGTIISMVLIDRVGRRPLLFGSLLTCAVALLALGAAFFPKDNVGWLALGGMCLYLVAFGSGAAPLPWVVNAEIYPQDVRGIGNGIAACANWVSNYIIAATFLDLTAALSTDRSCPEDNPDGAFWLYAAIAFAGLAWTWWVLPETQGKTLDEIDLLLST